jgi:hypothetical protein
VSPTLLHRRFRSTANRARESRRRQPGNAGFGDWTNNKTAVQGVLAEPVDLWHLQETTAGFLKDDVTRWSFLGLPRAYIDRSGRIHLPSVEPSATDHSVHGTTPRCEETLRFVGFSCPHSMTTRGKYGYIAWRISFPERPKIHDRFPLTV